MRTRTLVKLLNDMYPDCKIILNNDTSGYTSEILCEIDPATNHQDWSLAVSIIDKSVQHYHKATTEKYKIIKGELRLYIENQEIILKEGDEYTIEPGKVHYAIGNETWIEAYSTPGWRIEDHLLK